MTRTSAFRSTPTPQAPDPPPPPVGVVAAAVKSGDVPIYLRGVGTVIAFNNVLIRSMITGPLVKISFRQGQQVKEGDVLAVIDPRPYQAELDQAIANRDRDQAHLKNAKIDLIDTPSSPRNNPSRHSSPNRKKQSLTRSSP